MEFTAVNPANMRKAPHYSQAVRMGDLVFLSGQVARDEKGDVVGAGDIRAQAEQVFANLRTVLAASGSSLARVGKITVYTTSLEYRPVINEVQTRVFGEAGHFPASTFLVIDRLALPEFLLEIEAVAAVG